MKTKLLLAAWLFSITVHAQIIKPQIRNLPKDNAVQNQMAKSNWNFESILQTWTATGDAFNNQPVEGNTVTSDRVRWEMHYYNGGIGGDYWKRIPYPIGIKGNAWIGTYENGAGDRPQGTLTSKEFKLQTRYIHFLMGGGMGDNLYVALQIKKEDVIKLIGIAPQESNATPDGFIGIGGKRHNTENGEIMKRQVFDLKPISLNKSIEDIKALDITARIVIADLESGGWGHINADDFQFTDELPAFLLAGNNRYDADMPVWGFGDTHAHWVNNVGLQGCMHGTVGGNWQTTNIKNDIPPCDESAHGASTLTPAMLISIAEGAALKRAGERVIGDPGLATCGVLTAATNLVLAIPGIDIARIGYGVGGLDGLIGSAMYTAMLNPVNQVCGYPLAKEVFKHYGNNTPNNNSYPELKWFIDFPRWNTLFHQQMHITWVRRSYEGGQRMMVVPVGPAKTWLYTMTADGVTPSVKNIIEQQVAAVKEIAAKNSDWIQIAYTSKEAREIVLNNKMAVIIGLEHAEIGNYGFASAAEEVNWIHNLGIRHVFPIHNIDNKLGGAALFNQNVNSYNDLVNRESQDASAIDFHLREGHDGTNNYTDFKFSRSFMRQGMRLIPFIGFGPSAGRPTPFFYMEDVPSYDRFNAHKNKNGLTEFGKTYITQLMSKGFVIDIDHMSDLSQNEATAMLNLYSYPLISGHSNFRDLRRFKHETGKTEGNTRTEFTITDSRATEIVQSNGMFGIMSQQDDIEIKGGVNCPVANTSPGSSRSFAQAYWYVYQKTGGTKGISFGSDFNGFAPQASPRFGVDAAAFIEGDKVRNTNFGGVSTNTKRRQYAFMQDNGVKYDNPINTYHYHRFQLPPFLTQEERDIWEAIAIFKSGTDPNRAWQPGGSTHIDPARTIIQQNKIRNMALGFATLDVNFLDCNDYYPGIGDCDDERRAAYMVATDFDALPENKREQRTVELYNVIKPVWDLWKKFEKGPNEPLRRSYAYTGGRDFDFNLDGLANYGLFPDMIQDMKNTGFSYQHLTPLFMAAEQYIQAWERSENAMKIKIPGFKLK